MKFGNPLCDLCGQIHPVSFDCEAENKRDEMDIKKMVDKLITEAGAVPPVDQTQRQLLGGGDAYSVDHRELKPNGQQVDYIVLSPHERARGYQRPVRRTYVHTVCGVATTMGQALAETYARDPKFYGGTFCCGCGKHLDLWENDEPQFKWDDGTGVGT